MKERKKYGLKPLVVLHSSQKISFYQTNPTIMPIVGFIFVFTAILPQIIVVISNISFYTRVICIILAFSIFFYFQPDS